jgi:DNA-binding Lrp family transcriptional regulator
MDLILLSLLRTEPSGLTDKEHVDLARRQGISPATVRRRRRQHMAKGWVLQDGQHYRLNPTAPSDSFPNNVHFFRVFSTRPGAFVPLAGIPIAPTLMMTTLAFGLLSLPIYREMVREDWSRAWISLPKGERMCDSIGRPLSPRDWLVKCVDDCVRAYLSRLLEVLGQTVEAKSLEAVREITDVMLNDAKAICAYNINLVYHFRKKLSFSDLSSSPLSYKIDYLGKRRIKTPSR